MSPASYTSMAASTGNWVRDRARQVRSIRAQLRDLGSATERLLGDLEARATRIRERLGIDFDDADLLEVGHGQSPMNLIYFAHLGARAVGIDTDVTPTRDPRSWWRLARDNGLRRLLKTAGKELTGFGWAQRREIARQLGRPRLPPVTLLQGDGQAMPFADASFDIVFSTDVLEHVPEPGQCLDEVARVCRPGGGVALAFLHYAHRNALHDLRVILSPPGTMEPWAHLRPAHAATVQQGAFVNDLRIADWRRLVTTAMPGAEIELDPVIDVYRSRLRAIRESGEELRYDDEELLTERVWVFWRKPT